MDKLVCPWKLIYWQAKVFHIHKKNFQAKKGGVFEVFQPRAATVRAAIKAPEQKGQKTWGNYSGKIDWRLKAEGKKTAG